MHRALITIFLQDYAIIAFLVLVSLTIISTGIVTAPIYAATDNSTEFNLEKLHLTDRPGFISLVNNSNREEAGEIKPVITSGENLSNGFSFPGIPDGLGSVEMVNGTVDVYVNHEYNSEEQEGQHAKVSKLRLNKTDGSIVGAELVIRDSQGYESLCSASLVEGYGFEHPIFLTNEEADDGLVLAIDAINGTLYELPWVGRFSHENTIHVPYFYENANKTVVMGFEDADETESEVYMYVADTPNDLLHGKGQLYVLGAADNSTYNTWDDIYYNGSVAIDGAFIPLKWNYSTQNETDLDTEAIAAGGFQFIRPEDGAMDKRSDMQNILYLADTGGESDENDEVIPAGSDGQYWTNGRIYKFEFTDPKDPTKASFQVLFDGNDPKAPGYEILTNPDNLDTSNNSLMITEDLIDANRINATSPYNITQNAQILRVDLTNISSILPIAYVNQMEDKEALHGEWESSGILGVSKYFGEGAWLVDVQAHTIDEGGQLLLMRIPGS